MKNVNQKVYLSSNNLLYNTNFFNGPWFTINWMSNNLGYITTDTLLLFCYIKAITTEFEYVILGLHFEPQIIQAWILPYIS